MDDTRCQIIDTFGMTYRLHGQGEQRINTSEDPPQPATGDGQRQARRVAFTADAG
jgi:hypothetical protein